MCSWTTAVLHVTLYLHINLFCNRISSTVSVCQFTLQSEFIWTLNFSCHKVLQCVQCLFMLFHRVIWSFRKNKYLKQLFFSFYTSIVRLDINRVLSWRSVPVFVCLFVYIVFSHIFLTQLWLKCVKFLYLSKGQIFHCLLADMALFFLPTLALLCHPSVCQSICHDTLHCWPAWAGNTWVPSNSLVVS